MLGSYRLTRDQVEKLRSLLSEELRLGLQAKPVRESIFPMFNTFVTDFPTGTEVGDFLGVDIGGTNLRVIYLKLSKVNDREYQREVKMEFYDVPKEIRLGVGSKVF